MKYRIHKKIVPLALLATGGLIAGTSHSLCYVIGDCSDVLDYDACKDCSEGSTEFCGIKQAVFQQNPGILFAGPDLFLGGDFEEAWGVGPAHDCYAVGVCSHGENPPLPATQCDNDDDERGYYCDGPIAWDWKSGYTSFDTLDCE